MCDGCPYRLIVTFDNGEKRRFDVKPYIKGSWYGNLKDPGYFSAVSVNGYTVEWPLTGSVPGCALLQQYMSVVFYKKREIQ